MPDKVSTSAARVILAGITKTYDQTHLVVQNLDLEIAKGEFLTLLGPSGSGKTTILIMLAGFEYPTTGLILIDGNPVHTMPPERRNIGMDFQNYALLFPHMTVAENVGYGLKVRGVPKPEIVRRVVGVLDTVNLANLSDPKPGSLSGGQQQRVALARTLVFEPGMVLMDEPLGALDKKLREHLQLEIRQIADRYDLTVVYVTHDQYETLTLSDRIAILNDGRSQQLGSAQDIYARRVNRFVADFVGDNNCLSGEIVAIVDGRVNVRIRGDQIAQGRPTDHVRHGGKTSVGIRPEEVRLYGTLEVLFASEIWKGAIVNSLLIAIATSALATALGTLAPIGLVNSNIPFRNVVMALAISPMSIPVAALRLGLFIFVSQLGLNYSYTGAILAHTLMAIPFVIITVTATLTRFDFTLMRAAADLAAGKLSAFRTVMLPITAPGIGAGAVFASATLFDEVVIALLIAGPHQRTLPKQMFTGLREQLDSTIIAAAVTPVTITSLLLVLVLLAAKRR